MIDIHNVQRMFKIVYLYEKAATYEEKLWVALYLGGCEHRRLRRLRRRARRVAIAPPKIVEPFYPGLAAFSIFSQPQLYVEEVQL